MPNQYEKLTLFIEATDEVPDKYKVSSALSNTTIEVLKNILPKDIDSLDSIIAKVKEEL